MLNKYFWKKPKEPTLADLASVLGQLALIIERQERLLSAMHKAIVEIKKNTTKEPPESGMKK